MRTVRKRNKDKSIPVALIMRIAGCTMEFMLDNLLIFGFDFKPIYFFLSRFFRDPFIVGSNPAQTQNI